jgi:hypothetical protein
MSGRDRYPTLHRLLTSLDAWSSELLPHRALRPYQVSPAEAILQDIDTRGGGQFAVVFSRQASKDEMLAQMLSYLLTRRSQSGGNVVVAAPTLRPQAEISRDRLRDSLLANPLTQPITRARANTIHVRRARATFVSAAPTANARGQTADLLLVANEAQDIDPATWDAVFDPMAASTNATTLFMGTVWSHTGLLARQMRYLREMESADGRQRVWLVPWDVVAETLPAYGERVRARIQQLGADHPFIRTEYFLKELDGAGGLFPPDRIARMQGDHPSLERARPGYRYALLIDVGGEEEHPLQGDPGPTGGSRRDSTALTVVELDLDSRPDGLPVYRVVHRQAWTGLPHTTLHERIVGLATTIWKASWIVVDATGIGAGLASFLRATLGRSRAGHPPIEVVPFVFTAASKSRLGWDFLSLIDAGRFHEYGPPDPSDAISTEYRSQLRATTYEVVPGPGNLLRWSVPTRDGHDDLVISASLCAELDHLDHRPRIARGTS